MERGAAADDRPWRPWRGRPPRDVILLLLGAATLVVAFWLLMRLRSLLVMLLISFFLSFALEPPANLLARRGWRRGWPPRPYSRP
jgi:predicted PurR-regulated permease PerM